MRILILLSILLHAACCPTEKICPPPLTVNCEYKTWPIARIPNVQEFRVRRLDSPGVIAGLTLEDIDSIGLSLNTLILWGSKNEATLEKVNALKK